MYCPKCGQQQISGEMRFCSRCGFQLGVVTMLIATGGVPSPLIVPDLRSEKQLESRRRMRQGAKVIFASVVLFPLAIGLSILVESGLPFLIPFTVFMAGLAWMLYNKLFGEPGPYLPPQSAQTQFGIQQPNYLPSHQPAASADPSRPSPGTAEIVQPSSVTENTTRLLEEK